MGQFWNSSPKCHAETLMMEVEMELGVLKKVNRLEWAAPSFIIPKKNGIIRFINDFRELNKQIKQKTFPIPNIQHMLLNLEGFQYATSLDIKMGSYHMELCPDSKKLCTLVFPFGKYKMQQLPMGLCNSPNIFREKMSELFDGLEFVRTDIDDLLCLTKGSFEFPLSYKLLAKMQAKDKKLQKQLQSKDQTTYVYKAFRHSNK
jgi:hypothetical protein